MNLPRCVICVVVLSLLQVSPLCSVVDAQLQRQYSDRPFAIVYGRDLTAKRVLEYAAWLNTQLQLSERLTQEIQDEELIAGQTPDVEQPLVGNMWFLVTALVPEAASVSFERVADEDDARRMLRSMTKRFGENAVFEGSDGRYSITSKNSWETEVPDDYVVPETTPGTSMKHTLVERDGKKYLQQDWSFVQHFRYQDGILFRGEDTDVYEMTLPAAAEISAGAGAGRDFGTTIWLERIPIGMRTLAWNMLNSTAGTYLQPRDDEPSESSDLRQSAGELGLMFAKAVLFDVEHAEGWGDFAIEGQPMRGEFSVQVRQGGELSRFLGTLSSGRSRFAPIISDESGLTVHACIAVPEEAVSVVRNLTEWLNFEAGQNAELGIAMLESVSYFTAALDLMAENGTLEVLLKAGYSDETDGVFFGGIQVPDGPDVIHAMAATLTEGPDVPDSLREAVSVRDRDGLRVMEIRLPEFPEGFPLRLSHVFVTQQNDCLWFAVGTERAFGMLTKQMALCADNSRVLNTPLMTAEFRADVWNSWPQDDPSGIAGILYWLDSNDAGNLLAPGLSGFGDGYLPEPTPLWDRVAALGGEQHARASLTTAESGLLLKAEFGSVLGNYLIARQLETQERMMKASERRSEQAQREAQKAQALEEVEVEVSPDSN